MKVVTSRKKIFIKHIITNNVPNRQGYDKFLKTQKIDKELKQLNL